MVASSYEAQPAARHRIKARTGVQKVFVVFFFNDTATPEIYTLSLHDALPICASFRQSAGNPIGTGGLGQFNLRPDRKSTRLNSSHTVISYAVFCLKKKQHGCSALRLPLILRSCLSPTAMIANTIVSICFFFNDTATTEIYTLSLHDALPI